MGYWKKQHGLRGGFLEECINASNTIYLENGLAVVQKIPTPITPVEMDNEKRTITLAYFDQKSTVDYLGNVQGIPVCFDAKETKLEYFPLENIHEHQIRFMRAFDAQDGLAFLIVKFSSYDKTYLCPFETLEKYWKAAQNGGRKSIPYSAFEERYLVERSGNILMHYLRPLQTYLEEKEKRRVSES